MNLASSIMVLYQKSPDMLIHMVVISIQKNQIAVSSPTPSIGQSLLVVKEGIPRETKLEG